eukprot:ANDGO_05985.mRNA.1 Sphingomyelinase phosphodiesterase D
MDQSLLASNSSQDSSRSKSTRRRFFLGLLLFVVVVAGVLAIVLGVVLSSRRSSSESSNATPSGFFLQLSDLHIDPLYDPRCDATTRCRRTAVSANCGPSVPYAPYGRFGCDSPLFLLAEALAQAKLVLPNPSFILLTGDFGAHGLPNASITLQAIRMTAALIVSYFPTTPVFPVLGNNDVVPDYCLSCGPNPWLADLWSVFSQWLPDSAKTAFLAGGYYSAIAPSGMRVIGLNTLYFSKFQRSSGCDEDADFARISNERTTRRSIAEKLLDAQHREWALGNAEVPCGQDAFLTAELQAAESSGQRVLISGHIPPGVEAFDNDFMWNASHVAFFASTIASPMSQSTIASQHFAHYHRDDFRLFYNVTAPSESTGPYGSALLAPSLSPIYQNNPTFRVFEFDTNSAQLLNVESHYMLLEASNAAAAPFWSKLYDARSAYGLSDLSTRSLVSLRDQLRTNLGTAMQWADRRQSNYLPDRHALICAIDTLSESVYTACLRNATTFL